MKLKETISTKYGVNDQCRVQGFAASIAGVGVGRRACTKSQMTLSTLITLKKKTTYVRERKDINGRKKYLTRRPQDH